MKIIQINTFPYKATGHIMLNIHHILNSEGYDSYVCWGRGRNAENDHEIVINDVFGIKLHGAYARIFDRAGFASNSATKKLIERLEQIQPDIIHLHNIHGYYVNITLLFEYIRKNSIKVIWTLHDCWAMTGHCAWFDTCGCTKWIDGCNHCKQLDTYPQSLVFDNSKLNWKKKKELFEGLDMQIVTPSEWLKKIVKQSYLGKYPVQVIYNGINLNIFKPTQIENIRVKYGLDERPIVLGVASEWTPRKGLKDFMKLSELMNDIQFVVVGLTEKQINNVGSSIIGIKRTENAEELAGLYSIANVFFNPTYEDNFPTTNIEALACGTPVVTYDTGGSPEAIIIGEKQSKIGYVIKKETPQSVNYHDVEETIRRCLCLANENGTSKKSREMSLACKKAAKSFDMNNRLREYLELYHI